MSVEEPHTRFSGIKQDLLDFQNEINSVLVNIKTEMQSKFDESMANIKDSIINALKDDNKKLYSKIEDPETKLHETELSNWRNNIEIQGIPSNVTDEAMEDKVVNVFKSLYIDIKKSDIEGCQRLGKANPKNTVVHFVNRKHGEEALAKK